MTATVSDNVAALYQTLKRLSPEVRKDKRLPVPPAGSVTVHSARCGSQLTLDARIEAGVVREIGYRVRACSLGQTTTALVARHAPGMDGQTLRRIGEQLRAILEGRDDHSDWPELEVFALARDMPARHGSALLPFQALEKLFERDGTAADPTDTDVDSPTLSSARN